MEAPVFVKIDEYKDVLDTIQLAKEKLEDAKATIDRIDHVKQKEDNELMEWKAAIDDIEQRLEGIDNILFEPEA
ncbi:MAG: hypothetical protein KJ601_04790 [Nanoarchaeota archaeon]|nr:hypothetical protein [Nanoarchaeota archaeon]MBU1704537.1 hypothetical protein [Nanoarchaeota archaeon]